VTVPHAVDMCCLGPTKLLITPPEAFVNRSRGRTRNATNDGHWS